MAKLELVLQMLRQLEEGQRKQDGMLTEILRLLSRFENTFASEEGKE